MKFTSWSTRSNEQSLILVSKVQIEFSVDTELRHTFILVWIQGSILIFLINMAEKVCQAGFKLAHLQGSSCFRTGINTIVFFIVHFFIVRLALTSILLSSLLFTSSSIKFKARPRSPQWKWHNTPPGWRTKSVLCQYFASVLASQLIIANWNFPQILPCANSRLNPDLPDENGVTLQPWLRLTHPSIPADKLSTLSK